MNKIVKNDMDFLCDRFPYQEEIRNKTILVTGATGLIAKNFTMFLISLNRRFNLNIKVLALVRNMEKAHEAFKDFEGDDLEYLNQDICEPIKYDGNVDFIFHAAGSCSAEAIRRNPVGIIKANTIGTINVMDFAKDHGVEKVVFPSTREIYGQVEGVETISENNMGVLDPLNSRNCYPESKRVAEAILKSYSEQYGVNFNILRIAHTYGPGMEIRNDGRVMADFIGSVVDNKNILLNSDGTAIRAFCYVTDAVEGIMHVMMKGAPAEAYNLANETEPYMIRDVAQMLVDLYPERGLKVEFANQSDAETKKGYLGYKIVRLDTSKIESLGWEPQIKLQRGMKHTVDYFNN